MSTDISRPVERSYTPDPWPGDRPRFGLIVLSIDHATEPELAAFVPPHVACFHVDRVVTHNPCTVANLERTAEELTEAAARLLPDSPLDGILFACTSGAVVIGTHRIAELVHAARPGVPVITPIAAALDGMEQLGVERIAVLTPYVDEVNERIRTHLQMHGQVVVGFDSFRLERDIDMSSVPPAALRDAALGLDQPEADAIFICCTALRPSSIIDEVEQITGKPVITSHQAMVWDALRRSGRWTGPIAGQGRLLREPPAQPGG